MWGFVCAHVEALTFTCFAVTGTMNTVTFLLTIYEMIRDN